MKISGQPRLTLLPTVRLGLIANGNTGEPLLVQNLLSSIMSVWLLCALLSSLICQTEQDGHPLSIKDVNVYPEPDTSDYGAWVLNVQWRDEFAENNESSKVIYDIKVFRSENMSSVHNETIYGTPDNTTHHHWKWTSPIPLQCTSHSVKLRRRDEHHIGEWTSLFTSKGQDLEVNESVVYPKDQVFLVGSNVTFCCIFKTAPLPNSSPKKFQIRISNRTYITKPIHFQIPKRTNEVIICDYNEDSAGSVVFIGYPPDDHDLECMTRNLSSVECHWKQGRRTYLEGNKRTNYTLTGGFCDFDKCVLHEVPKQVTNWTVTAKNPLGVKILTDTADPAHRVWLRAPSMKSHTANARSVTLQWKWNVNVPFPLICQVMLNESIYYKTLNGTKLSSITLVHLQPFSNYTVKMRCGSDEHFYKWSDWSNVTEFSTKEDIPEPVDVWIQYFKQNTCVLWKPLTPQQSHGIITQYELTIGKKREIIEKGLNYCNITPGNERSDQNITVSAKNSAGLSPPSTIIVSGYPDKEVNIRRISNPNGSFEMVWDKCFSSTCSYVVEWFPTYCETQCAVEWKKIPECDHAACRTWNRTWNQNDTFKDGVKYTVSVYALIDDKPMLLQRSEGYAVEKRPSGTVQNLRSKPNGRNLELSWDEVPLQLQNGFIQGYIVRMFHSESKTTVNTTDRKVDIMSLDPGLYTFSVSAFTSGGEGDSVTIRGDTENNIDQMITATVVGCSAATLVFIMITVLCYRKRKWLKELLYPDIPKPKLTAKWNTKGIYCTQMTEGYMKCEIQELHTSERPATAESLDCLDLISSKSTVFPAQHYQNTSTSPVDVSYIPPPLSCAEKLPSIIENPSYNMTIPEPANVAQISELTLEMQDSYLPAPIFVQKNVVVKDSPSYKAETA